MLVSIWRQPKRTLVLVGLLLVIAMSDVHAQIPQVERDALIALYNSTDGANWNFNANWLGAEGRECTWYGVICTGGHVSFLTLGSNQLTGSIPPELGNLSGLRLLNLESNQLTGSIPPEFGNLSSLLRLNLASNQLSGSIPSELGNLSSIEGLFLHSNQLTGIIPPELGNLSSLLALHLESNQLTGIIPPELGSASSLQWVYLDSNQLSGTIPAELGNLSKCSVLHLESNQLTGVIPEELGNMPSLRQLFLDSNELSGSIPPRLGNLPRLQWLYLNSNKLSGDIPEELEDLSALGNGYGLDLRWNALHSDNATLISFLNSKQRSGFDWQSTQTIAPENLDVDWVGDHTVWLSWDAVSYQSDPGGYEAFFGPTGSGVWTSAGWTESKTITTFPVTGLDPTTCYDFAVVAYTDPHLSNLNLVNSDFSPQVMATTTSVGCAQPIIEIAWGDPIILSVSGSYDSYLWSTGETTSIIDIVPPFEKWFWVTVTSAGPCEETAAVSVDPTSRVFADGFESGDTSAWSSTVVPACIHDLCETGLALEPQCDSCVDQICAVDNYCCTVHWDRTCVDQVASVCGLTCN